MDPERQKAADMLQARIEKYRHDRKELLQALRLRGDSAMPQVREDWKLEKFDGEWEPGKVPVETIEGGDGKPTVRRTADGATEIVQPAEDT